MRVLDLPGNIVHLFNMMPFLELRLFFYSHSDTEFCRKSFYMIHMKVSAS